MTIAGICVALFLSICANRYINDWHAARLRDHRSNSQEVEARLKSVILQRKKLEFELKSKENQLYNLETQLEDMLQAEGKTR